MNGPEAAAPARTRSLCWWLVDAIDELVAGERAVGGAVFPDDLEIFDQHFPGTPVVPGVLLLEAAAQLGGLLVSHSVRVRKGGPWVPVIMTMARHAKFRRVVLPGERVRIEIALQELRDTTAQVAATVSRPDGARALSAGIVYFVGSAVAAADGERAADEEAKLRRLWPALDATMREVPAVRPGGG